jgi:hypothetical protein
MPSEPVSADPERDHDLAWLDRDPMTAEERDAWLDWLCEHDDDPFDAPQEYWDPESCAPPPGQDELTAGELAGIREAAADELLAVEAATAGRRGPGQPGSARKLPGESSSPAAAFAPGMALDVLPGCAGLAVAADAAGDEDKFAVISEGELVGLLCAWDRVEAHAAARKLAVVAELARRSTTPRMKRAGEPVFVTPARSAATTIASSNTRNGRWISSPTGPSGGPPRPGAPTPPNPPGIPSKSFPARRLGADQIGLAKRPQNARQPSGSGRAAGGAPEP